MTQDAGPQANGMAQALTAKRLKRWASWLVMPVIVAQGLAVRRAQPRLLPPKGNWIRTVGSEHPAVPLRLLIIGDSSVAGVGVASLEDGLAVQIAAELAEHVTRPVALRIAGANSATSDQLRDYVVPNLPGDVFDIVLVVVGMNDAKNLHSSRRFLRNFGTLAYSLTARFPSAVVAHWPIAPASIFPKMPQPLSWFLKQRTNRIDALAACLSAERGVERFPRSMTFPVDGFARDGFHINERGCDLWARDVVEKMMENPQVSAKLSAL